MTTTHEFEPAHRSSATARVIENLELHGYQPSGRDPDPRPLPDTELVAGAISDLFDILGGALRDTGLEPDSTTFSGTSPISSTKRPPARSVSSTTTKTGKGRARRNRTARKCARSSSKA